MSAETPPPQPQPDPGAPPNPYPGYYPPPAVPGAPEAAHAPEPYWYSYDQHPGWDVPAQAGPEFRPVPTWGWLAALGVVLLGAAISAFVGQFGNYMVAAAQGAPFAILGLLAYVSRRQTWALVMGFLFLALILLTACGLTFLFSVMAVMAKAGALTSERPRLSMPPGAWEQIGGVVIWCLIAWLSGIVVALPPVRRWLAARLPLDPDSTVHAIGLATVVPLTVLGFGQLAAFGGRPVLLTMVQHSQEALKSTADDLVAGMVLGFLWMLPCALVTVGWPLVRSFPEALERIGWVRPTRKQVLGALALAIVMVFVFQGLDHALSALWDWTRWPKTDASAFEKLLKPLITPMGAILIGVTAGIGEEVVVRGVLQPRFGILLSNLFFVSLHAFQYGFDGLISVFAAGLVLGVLRSRTNTTTSAITHGVYDFILVLYSWYSGG